MCSKLQEYNWPLKEFIYIYKIPILKRKPESFLNHSEYKEYDINYLAELKFYLTKQYYEQSQITILTIYVAQMYKIKKFLIENPSTKKIKVSTVDNFQGQENNIILLSFVRSNQNNNVGFSYL